ncbi:hypothetical protein MK852_13055 [Shewanella benthica]|nr:hypothetical protein [Shewanella benthica]
MVKLNSSLYLFEKVVQVWAYMARVAANVQLSGSVFPMPGLQYGCAFKLVEFIPSLDVRMK